jgi:lipopolysaccharide transport system permease protein
LSQGTSGAQLAVDQTVNASSDEPQERPRGAGPASPITHIEPTAGWAVPSLRDLWAYRELLYFLVWRDIKVHYKQTALGVAWVVLQPVVATLIFTAIFGYFVRLPTPDLPYPIFAFSGFLIWGYFAGVLTRSGTSLVNNAHLITKVYFPRLLVPLAGTLNGLVDLLVGMIVLLLFMPFFGVVPSVTILATPVFVALALVSALGVSLWLSALDVKYRDVKHILPFLVQVWMYASPIIYPSTMIPSSLQPVYGLNPMVGAVEGFRWAMTGRGEPPLLLVAISGIVGLLFLASGAMFFRRTERTFADTI